MLFLLPLNIIPHLDEFKGQARYNWFPQPQGPLNSDSNTAVTNVGFHICFNETNRLPRRGFILKKPWAKTIAASMCNKQHQAIKYPQYDTKYQCV